MRRNSSGKFLTGSRPDAKLPAPGETEAGHARERPGINGHRRQTVIANAQIEPAGRMKDGLGVSMCSPSQGVSGGPKTGFLDRLPLSRMTKVPSALVVCICPLCTVKVYSVKPFSPDWAETATS